MTKYVASYEKLNDHVKNKIGEVSIEPGDSLTDEVIQDKVGAMVTGSTQTGITVTYQDSSADIDFVVDAGIVAAPARLDALEEYNEYVSDGAVATLQGVALLTKAGVGAYTLALPGAGDDGKQLIISNGTANAHVVTLPDEQLYDGTGTPKDTITFDAQIGASVHLVAINETWHMVGANDTVTLSDAV